LGNFIDTYVGRFAPSPTGELHLGSVVTAVASYIRSRQKRGRWLLRIDDLDKKRERAGARDLILKGLNSLSLHWDEFTTQERNFLDYKKAITSLRQRGCTYACECSRKSLPKGLYSGRCRNLNLEPTDNRGIRIKVNNSAIKCPDSFFGKSEINLVNQSGDFLIKPRDREAAYHLAVVVDDSKAGVTEIVRGADLLDSTPMQAYLYQQLNLQVPEYFHIPVVKDNRGVKLSKQMGAVPIDLNDGRPAMLFALEYLGFVLPRTLRKDPSARLLQWAIKDSGKSILESLQSRFSAAEKKSFNSV
tara:strand:- start:16 stop:921 length:906 start_codon:yes stop_codon:yes gene_type:complete